MGGTIIGSSTSSSVEIQWTSGGNKSVSLTVTRQGQSASDTLNVSVTANNLPIVITVDVVNVLRTSATLQGRIENVGNPAYTEKGFYYLQGSTGTPTQNDNKVTVSGTGTGDYSSTITGLTENTNYRFRAFSTNTEGTGLGIVIGFKTQEAPKNCYFIFVPNSVSTTNKGVDYVSGGQIQLVRFSQIIAQTVTYDGVEGSMYGICSESQPLYYDFETQSAISDPAGVQRPPMGVSC